MKKIDFVVLWVDDSDPDWLALKDQYEQHQEQETQRLYRDYQTFHYWFRMVEKNVPWVNKIYLITWGHLPSWLNPQHPKLEIIRHQDYIPEQYLPTFNSNVIELNLHRLEQLSENFILFNDDMFVIKPIKPSDYYKRDLPKLTAVYNAIVPFESFSRVIYNNVEVLNRHFKQKQALRRSWQKFFHPSYGRDLLRNFCLLPWGLTGYVNYHLPSPLKKSTLARLWQLEEPTLDRMSRNHVRNHATDINHWLLNYWQIESNQFEPAPRSFGQFMTISDYESIQACLRDKSSKVICVNDSVATQTEDLERLAQLFQHYFPEKSEFEL